MKEVILCLTLLALWSGNVYSQGSLTFGDEDQSYGDQGQEGGQKKGGTGLERKKLLDNMKVMDYTELPEDQKCKTKCNMNFSTCYRMQTDRGKCYTVQQECLGKCGGDQEPGFGEDPSGGGGEYGF